MPYYVYFMTNKTNKVLYVGVTNNIQRRVFEHKNSFDKKSFASRYNCHKLVYVEEFSNVYDAIAREKCIKDWPRSWKNNAINGVNPGWEDLYGL